MLEALLSLLQDSSLSLWGPFLLLILCGLGLPLPEDIVLVTAGILAQDDGRSWVSTACLMYLGVVAGDSMIFMLGRRFGQKLLAWEFTHHLFPPRKQAKVQRKFDRYGTVVLFVARFLPGLRAPIFSTAGAMRISFLRFLLLDGLAALVSVPVFVWLGHWLWSKFNDDLKQLHAALSQTNRYSLYFIGALVLCAILAIWWVRTRPKTGKPGERDEDDDDEDNGSGSTATEPRKD